MPTRGPNVHRFQKYDWREDKSILRILRPGFLGALLVLACWGVQAQETDRFSEKYLQEARTAEQIVDFLIEFAAQDWSNPEQVLKKMPLSYQLTKTHIITISGKFPDGLFLRALQLRVHPEARLVGIDLDLYLKSTACVKIDYLLKRFAAAGYPRRVVEPQGHPHNRRIEYALEGADARRTISVRLASVECVGALFTGYHSRIGSITIDSIE